LFFEKKENVFIWQFKSMVNNANVLLCTSTRRGGVSKGEFSSLNLGTNTIDAPNAVGINKNIFFSSLNISDRVIAVPKQIHSSNVLIAEHGGVYSDCDGLITNKRNVCLSIQTADCMPLFLYSEKEHLIGLIHAGWRGAVGGIVKNAINIMIDNFNIDLENINAFIGPCIRQCCYKIKENVASYFPDYYINNDYLNLPEYVKDELINFGVNEGKIEDSELCTSCNKDIFYSYRRDNGRTGRMLSLMMLR